MKTIAVVAPFPNPHFLKIFESPEFLHRIKVDRFCFRSLPEFRQGLGWKEADFTKLSSSYLKIPATQNSVSKYSTVVFYGAVDPRCIPVAMMLCCLRRGQRTFLVTEGIRFQHPRWRSMVFSLLLNHSGLEILAIGDRSEVDFRQAGLTKPTYRKFGFFENYPPDVMTTPGPEDTCRILSVGRLIERKNFLSIINSLQRIAAQSTQRIVYSICGDGDQRAMFESAIEKLPNHVEVNLLGNCNSQQLDQCFRNADLFAMPSTYDGWGVVLNQAVHYRLPIIVSGGVRAAKDHLVEDGFNGYIYNTKAELDDYLLKLTQNRQLRKELSVNSQEIADAWQIDTVARSLASVMLGEEPQRESRFAPLGRL